jgi:DNA ligase 1
MQFRNLSTYLEKLEQTSSRNEITAILVDLFKKVDATEIDKVVYLLAGRLAPNYRGIEFNVAERMMWQVLAKAYNTNLDEIKTLYKQKGDVGSVASELAKKQESNITVSEVYEQLWTVAHTSGAGSVEQKIAMLSNLLGKLDPLSARFVSRIPVGNLRLGFSDMTVLDALSFICSGDKSSRKEIEAAFNVSVDMGRIAHFIKEKGLSGVQNIKPVPGTPIRPSLAERLPSAEKMFEKVGETIAVEPKYDGFRVQMHVWKKKNGEKEVMLLSRNLENTTTMFPELVEAAKKINVDSAIFDGEAIAFNEKENKFLPFQETIARKRKHGIKEAAKKSPLVMFAFDILFKDGESYLEMPFSQRREMLLKTIGTKVDDTIRVTEEHIVTDPKVLRDLIATFLSKGLEGGMVKKIDAEYKAGGRGYHWVKYKKTTEAGVADTVDCVVMGLYAGRGKRAELGFGAFLIGVKDNDGKYYTVTNLGSGIKDEQFPILLARTKKLTVPQMPNEYVVDKMIMPDVWVKPEIVLEILADEITPSPRHTAGRNEKGKGYSFRFPRLIKIRDDKSPEDATTVSEVKKLYEMQKV